MGAPVVFATSFSGHRQHPAKRTITLCARPERAGRPRSNRIVPDYRRLLHRAYKDGATSLFPSVSIRVHPWLNSGL